MRGYISFLIVLCALAIFAALITSYSSSINLSRAIVFERAEQLSLDYKRSMLTAAKFGAIAGFLEYSGEVAASGGEAAFSPEEAKAAIKRGVISSILLISLNGDPDYEVSLWCAEIGNEAELSEMAQSSLEKRSAVCPSCIPILLCGDFVDAQVLSNSSFANLVLGSRNLGAKPRIFGVSIYSERFSISKISYIPTSEKLFEIPYELPGGSE